MVSTDPNSFTASILSTGFSHFMILGFPRWGFALLPHYQFSCSPTSKEVSQNNKGKNYNENKVRLLRKNVHQDDRQRRET